MDDLISRKAVIDLIDKRIEERKPDGNSIWLRNDEAIDIQAAVEELPTAYDVDNVVEQLETNLETNTYYSKLYDLGIKHAISIVKGVVKDE